MPAIRWTSQQRLALKLVRKKRAELEVLASSNKPRRRRNNKESTDSVIAALRGRGLRVVTGVVVDQARK